MREFRAIPIVAVLLGILVVILWAANAGMWAWIVVGVVLPVALAGFGLFYAARPHHPTRRAVGPAEVLVIAPALGSRTARWTGDEHAYQDAVARLEATLQALRQLDVTADGHVGSHDPLQAVEDGLRELAADEIVFAVQADGDANWLERGVVLAARSRFPLPVSEVTIARS